MTEDKLKQKETFFEQFLVGILRNPDLRGSFFLSDFLSVTEDSEFQKVIKNREKQKAPEKLDEMYSVSGQLKSSSTVETWQYCEEMPDFTKRFRTLNSELLSLSQIYIDQSS